MLTYKQAMKLKELTEQYKAKKLTIIFSQNLQTGDYGILVTKYTEEEVLYWDYSDSFEDAMYNARCQLEQRNFF
jgi:hypothetical protein